MLANVTRRLPQAVRRVVRKAYHTVPGYMAYSSRVKEYQRKYGTSFVATIDRRDEMFRAVKALWRDQTEWEARSLHLQHGESLLIQLESVLQAVGRSYGQIHSLLDFACGYGRITRYLVHRLERRRITVSDIDQNAVDFVCNQFAVQGFYSVADPGKLEHAGRYDVILVVSLFSHLPHSTWTAWLQRLFAMLNEKGHLVFSTMSTDVYPRPGDESQARQERIVDGFYYKRENETHGRLPESIYGSTYVTRDYVESVVRKQSLGRLIGHHPKGLDRFQDIYVIEK